MATVDVATSAAGDAGGKVVALERRVGSWLEMLPSGVRSAKTRSTVLSVTVVYGFGT